MLAKAQLEIETRALTMKAASFFCAPIAKALGNTKKDIAPA